MAAGLALMASALWGAADFGGGTFSRRLNPAVVMWVMQIFGALTALVAVVALGDFHLGGASLTWGVIGGLLGPAGLWAFYRALSIGSMGVVAPIASAGVVVPILFGVASGERPASLQVLGIAIALVGVILAAGPELDGGGSARQSVLLAAFAAVSFGLVSIALARGSQDSVGMTLFVGRLVNVVIVAAALALTRTAVRAGRRDLPGLALVGVGDVAANGLFGLASRTGMVSVVSVLASLYPVVTTLLAWHIHGERLRTVQVAGVAAAVAGVVLIGVA